MEMEIDRIKAELRAYINAQGDYKYWLLRWRELQDVPMSQPMTGMPGGTPDGSQPELQAEQREVCRQRMLRAQSAKDAALDRVCAIIDTAPTIEQRNVLRRRYLEGKTWEAIAEAEGKTRQRVTVIHGNALSLLRLPDE